MNNHDKYIGKLELKNILVRPLVKYINAQTKIRHKCTCGNSWDITPTNVLNGVRCSCTKGGPTKTHEMYIEKLLSKSILVQPEEKYINSSTKILHRCTCGTNWKVTPSNVLKGQKCGCKSTFHNLDFYKDKKTILYYIEMDSIYKIGITLYRNNIEKSINKRFLRDIKKGLSIKIIQTKVFKDGSKAYLKEQSILNENVSKAYKGKDILFSGNTELFSEDIRNIK